MHKRWVQIAKLLISEGAEVVSQYQNAQNGALAYPTTLLSMSSLISFWHTESDQRPDSMVLDKYGWIVNSDPEKSANHKNMSQRDIKAKEKKEKQREKKWEKMLNNW